MEELSNFETWKKFTRPGRVEQLRGVDVKKILILRSARMWQVEKMLVSLKADYPDATCDVLSQPSAVEACEAHADIDRVISYPEEKLLLRRMPPRLLLELVLERYDLLVVVLNNTMGVGYENVYRLANAVRPRRKVTYCPHTGFWSVLHDFIPGPGLKIALAPLVAAGALVMTIHYNIAKALHGDREQD